MRTSTGSVTSDLQALLSAGDLCPRHVKPSERSQSNVKRVWRSDGPAAGQRSVTESCRNRRNPDVKPPNNQSNPETDAQTQFYFPNRQIQLVMVCTETHFVNDSLSKTFLCVQRSRLLSHTATRQSRGIVLRTKELGSERARRRMRRHRDR